METGTGGSSSASESQGIPAGLLANLCGSHALEAFHRNAEALKRLEEIQKIVINQKVDACLWGRGAVGSARSIRGTKRPSEALKAAYLKKSESLSGWYEAQRWARAEMGLRSVTFVIHALFFTTMFLNKMVLHLHFISIWY